MATKRKKNTTTAADPAVGEQAGRTTETPSGTFHIHIGGGDVSAEQAASALRRVGERLRDEGPGHILAGTFADKVGDEVCQLLKTHQGELLKAYDESDGELTVGFSLKIEATEATVTMRFAPAPVKDFATFEVDDPAQPALPGMGEDNGDEVAQSGQAASE